uniref:Uncharacterized protein n=1 Tax=Ascaris lumbricoides TaxID=6252 RepID=A0A0M3ISS5_ASCLU
MIDCLWLIAAYAEVDFNKLEALEDICVPLFMQIILSYNLNKSEVISLKRLYYPVNTPMCHYQRQLVVDSLFINLLIALPNELDSFFVASIVMFNFRRYYFSMCILYMFFENQNFFSISL